jgi:glycosyltransferase involved in cell wall biosynthesis
MDLPFVSIIIPCRNEEKYIALCLESIINNDYNKELMEILIVDGLSQDSSQRIVFSYIEKFRFIKLLNNPRKTFPSAVNIGIRASKGSLLFIMGAHAQYDNEYISKCVTNSINYCAENTGGILITKSMNKSLVGNIVTTVLSSPFGVGNSVFRTGADKIMEVDTLFGGCYKREVFDRIGLFNENLISTSDYEFNKRLRRSGGKIILVPEVRATYYTRTTFKSFMLNNFRNGFWSVFPIAFVNYLPVSFRHLVPLIFLLSLAGSFILSLFIPILINILFGILILYFLAAIYFTIKTLQLKLIIFLPFFFLLLHLSYGLGSFIALLKIILLKIFKRVPGKDKNEAYLNSFIF